MVLPSVRAYLQVTIAILKFSLSLHISVGGHLVNMQIRSQNEVKSDCPISKKKKGILEVICAKFHDFFTKCTRGFICKTYPID